MGQRGRERFLIKLAPMSNTTSWHPFSLRRIKKSFEKVTPEKLKEINYNEQKESGMLKRKLFGKS